MTDGEDRGSRVWVANIQRFSVDDGPGIRTTVFLMGCTLACAWCHNPECLSPGACLQFHHERCIGCGLCVRVCPYACHMVGDGTHRFDRRRCGACFACVEQCPADALVRVGALMSVDEIVRAARRDEAFMDASGGGVTLSGGEALMHAGFLREALSACRESGLHTALDTSGNVPWSAFEAVLPHTDLFLYDMKFASDDLHRRWTAVGNGLILENLAKLCVSGARIWLRIPVILGINSGDEMRNIAEIVDSLPHVERVELLPYHPYGVAKYRTLGLAYGLPDAEKPTAVCMRDQAALFRREVLVK